MRLIAIRGVVGTAVGARVTGQPVIVIFTKVAGVAGLPDSLEGVPVDVKLTGPFFAKTCNPNNCANTAVWPTPVPIGVSTGNVGQCGSGTIGARVVSGTSVYALSNNHVYALNNSAPLNSNVLQPGAYDGQPQCSSNGLTVIGTLSAFAPIQFCSATCPSNTIDAAIAVSDVTRLDNATPPAAYWWPNSVTRSATVGLGVKKYGRSTSLTSGQVTGIDATVTVGGSGSDSARFVHQIVISGCTTACGGHGDSGSLWVTNDASVNPVGLLFAGNADGSTTLANPIDSVLAYFRVTIDNSPHPTASGPGLTAGCGLCNPQIIMVAVSGNTMTVRDNGGNTGTITFSGFTPTDGGGGCGFGQCWVSAVTASGNTITVVYFNGTNDVITLPGVTASGGLTANCGLCNGAIESVTATGSNEIFLTDNGGNSGYIRLSY